MDVDRLTRWQEERRGERPPAAPRAEVLADLRKAVGEMPAQMRRCVLLRVYQDLKYREIAEVMGIKLDTVKAHLGQARARLERELGDGGQIPARLREDDK